RRVRQDVRDEDRLLSVPQEPGGSDRGGQGDRGAREQAVSRWARAGRAALFLLALGVGDCSPRPAAPEIEPHRPETRTPGDRGRTPAETMSSLGADWLTRAERIEEEQPDRMLAALHLRPGMVVADIGAGVGYHAIRISALVGPAGRVYATDLQPEMLALM